MNPFTSSALAHVAAASIALLLAACGPQPGGAAGVEDAGAASSDALEPAAEAAVDEPASDVPSADLARGEILSFACRACHGLAPDEPSPIGPPLHGMFGRRAASLPNFDYSPALEGSGLVWTAETLDAWLARPDEYIPGNAMAFTGFRSADDRRALIAYLKRRTEAPAAGGETGPP